MLRLFVLAVSSLVAAAYAANVPCPSGWLIGPTAQTATGVGPNTINPRGSPALVVQALQTGAGTATTQVEICCAPADCSANASWALVTGSPMSTAAATPALAVSVTAPACLYRANVTACSSCSVTVAAACGGP